MPRRKAEQKAAPNRRLRPATTLEARESQLVSLALEVAEERLLNRTATGQEITQILRMGSTKAQEELEKLRRENEFLKAKTDAIEASRKGDEIYEKALRAFRTYSGTKEYEDDEPYILGID